ncbi:cytochrome oxidase small assembly protein [Aquabacterium sp.]|nr:cytochrome oxidase small assembly protein [Aquabacterium sp.]HSW03385.1 cytochrome oxidase small assembly protein [Aquabacterium sp.]
MDPQAQQRKANVRLALTLASVAVIFGIGFVAKVLLFGR